LGLLDRYADRTEDVPGGYNRFIFTGTLVHVASPTLSHSTPGFDLSPGKGLV
jgi:hypothetical protein